MFHYFYYLLYVPYNFWQQSRFYRYPTLSTKFNFSEARWIAFYWVLFCNFAVFHLSIRASQFWIKNKNKNLVEKDLSKKKFFWKLFNWNESVYCTQIDIALKIWFQKVPHSFLHTTNHHSWVTDVFLELIVLLFGQIKCTNIRRFLTIFRHKTRVFSLQRIQKVQL